MATHSSILAWRIPRTEEPGGLQSMGSPKSHTRLSDWTTPTKHSDRLFLRRGLWPSRTYAVPGKVSSHVNGYKRTLETFSPTCTQRDSADTQKAVPYKVGSAAQHHRSFSRILCLQVSLPDKTCNPNIKTSQHFHSRAWMHAVCGVANPFESPHLHTPNWEPTRQPTLSLLISAVNKRPFRRWLSATFLTFLCISPVISPSECPPSTGLVSSSVSKCKKTVRCRTARVSVLDKLHSGRGYGAASCELHANKSTLYIKTHIKQRLYTDQLVKMLWPEACRYLIPYVA